MSFFDVFARVREQDSYEARVRRRIALAGLMVLTSACEATAGGTLSERASGGPAMEPPFPYRESSGGMRYIRMEDLPPELAAYMRAEREKLEQAEFPWVHLPLRIALTERDLPQDAVAMVIRDPQAPHPRLIVISEATLSDRSVALARLALMEDEFEAPQLTGRRTIYVRADQHVETNGRSKQMRYNLAPNATGEAQEVRRSAARGRTENVAGVGPVRIAESEP